MEIKLKGHFIYRKKFIYGLHKLQLYYKILKKNKFKLNL